MNVFPEAIQQHLVLVLAHFVWQGLLMAVLAAGLLAGLRKRKPTLRYGGMLIVFGLLTASPVATWCFLPETTADSLTTDVAATELDTSDPTPAGHAKDVHASLEPAVETTRQIPSGLPDHADPGPEFLPPESIEGTLSQRHAFLRPLADGRTDHAAVG